LANRASGTGIGKPTADSAASRTFKLSTSVAQPRFTALLLGLFAVVALFLTALGLYGVLAYNVAQRTREIGVRMALGAQPAAVVKLVLNRCLALTLLGVGPGVTSSLALTQLLKKFLFGVRATDPLTFGLIAGLLLLVALCACLIPARRATRVDPRWRCATSEARRAAIAAIHQRRAAFGTRLPW
jgi:putative ABC transport system permease protein